jgi:predicted component of type VI protein secretion system
MMVCPQINLRFDPQGKPFFIGSESSVQVFLESRQVTIAPKQMRILPVPGGWKIENGNFQAEVKISGVPLRAGSCPLNSGDVIEIGGYELLWVDHDSKPVEAAPATSGDTSSEPQKAATATLPINPPENPLKGCAPALFLLTTPFWLSLLLLIWKSSG